jgi:hypothetical protein
MACEPAQAACVDGAHLLYEHQRRVAIYVYFGTKHAALALWEVGATITTERGRNSSA